MHHSVNRQTFLNIWHTKSVRLALYCMPHSSETQQSHSRREACAPTENNGKQRPKGVSAMRKSCLLTLIAMLAVSIAAFAHHGTGVSYDASKPVTFKATVTEFRYANPHPQ